MLLLVDIVRWPLLPLPFHGNDGRLARYHGQNWPPVHQHVLQLHLGLLHIAQGPQSHALQGEHGGVFHVEPGREPPASGRNVAHKMMLLSENLDLGHRLTPLLRHCAPRFPSASSSLIGAWAGGSGLNAQSPSTRRYSSSSLMERTSSSCALLTFVSPGASPISR